MNVKPLVQNASGPLGSQVSAGANVVTDNFRPKTTPYTAPILFGNGEHAIGGEPRQIVFVPRDGQEGAWFEFGDMNGAAVVLYNGVKNYTRGGWGAIINYHRHDNAAVTVGSGAKTTISSTLQSAFGADAAHLGSTRGSYWTYTQTCSKLFVNAFRYNVNGGNLLIAVDNNPYPNGRNLKTVTAAQVATAEFNATVLAGLPAPWNTLSTLEGCKYIDCYSDTDNGQWNEIWSGAEGSHTVRACETATNSALGATGRAYISAFGYTSTADTAATSTNAPPRPGANTSGRTLAPYLTIYPLLSMQHLLEEWKPSGAANYYFAGGNHTDPGTVSQESASTGYFTAGTLTSASSAVSSVIGTDDIQDGDRLVAMGNQPLQLTVQTPSGKTASTFNLTAAPTISNTTSGTAFRMLRADWTITTGATSATQAFTGTHLPVAGDSLWIMNSSGTSIFATVLSVSGSNVTLDASVTTTTGDWVVLLGCAESFSLFNCQYKSYLARQYEIIVMPINSLTWKTRAMRSHSQVGTTLSAAAARGDTTVAVTSATNLNAGTLIAIYGTTGRFVTRITAVSGTTLTLARKLPFGFASGSRATYGIAYDACMRFKVGDTYSAEYDGSLSEYRQGDEAQTMYSAMMTVSSLMPNGYTYLTDGTATTRTWVNSNTSSSVVPFSAAVMSGRGVSSVIKVEDCENTGFFQTRGAEAISKIYFSSAQAHLSFARFPSTVIRGGFSLDFRNITY